MSPTRLRPDHVCTECSRTFMSEWDADKHRTGSQLTSARRCMTDEELLSAQWEAVEEADGAWAHPTVLAAFISLGDKAQKRVAKNRYRKYHFTPGQHDAHVLEAAKIESWTDRLWDKVIKEEGGCWTWVAASNGVALPRSVVTPPSGIGSITVRSPRAVFIASCGYPPGGYMMRTCKNKRCVNPEHFEIDYV